MSRGEATPEWYQHQSHRYWRLCEELFDALHGHWRQPTKGKEPKGFWFQQNFDFLHVESAKRGIDIDRSDLLETAAWYLTEPELRTNRLDWVFLEAMIFMYLDAHGAYCFLRGADTKTNWAAVLAEGSARKYFALVPVVWLFRIGLTYALWPALAYFLYVNEHATAAAVIAGLWALYLALRLVTLPFRIRVRRKAGKLLKYLGDLYAMLGEHTISPRKLKEKLDTGAADGFVCDGTVFSIVDRIVARDPTAFIPYPT